MINQASNSSSTNNTQKLGPLWLMPGIGPINAISFFAVAMINNVIFSLVHYMQPYVFEVQLKIPGPEQGLLVGNLTVMQELIVIAMTGIAGALADKYGRRPIFCGGTLLIGLAYALYPMAVLSEAVVLASNAYAPTATLLPPVVLLASPL